MNADQTSEATTKAAHEAWRRRASRLFWLLLNDGCAFQMTGELDIAHVRYSRCLALAQKAHSRRDEGAALSALGQLAQQRSQLAAAARYYQQALVILREVSDRQREGADLVQLAVIAERYDDYPHARQLYSQALDALRETEDAINNAGVAHSLAMLLLVIGGEAERAEGCELLTESLLLCEKIGIPGADDVRATAARFCCDIEL